MNKHKLSQANREKLIEKHMEEERNSLQDKPTLSQNTQNIVINK